MTTGAARRPDAFTLRPFATPGERIGLLGGSFNPAHDGHLHLSRLALTRLDLDRVWWLVSPGNPLKRANGDMAPFADRLASARAVAQRDPRVEASGVEAELGAVYTAETLPALCARFPHARFVWLMGADNLIQIPRWKRWTVIFETMPVAVIGRPGYGRRARLGKAATRFADARVAPEDARLLPSLPPPAWVFLAGPLNGLSASALRARGVRAGG